MRTSLVIGLLVISIASLGCSGKGRKSAAWTAPDKIEVIDGEITAEKPTSIQEIMEDPEAYVGKTLLVEGEVTGRCQGSGCWVSLDTGDPDNPFYVKSSDHSFTFPASCEEKVVWVQGVWNVMQPKAPEKHEGEGDDDHEEGHVCPEPVYFLEPQAAVAQK